MKAYEIPGEVLSSGQIEMSAVDLAEIPVGSKVKVIILVEEENDDDMESATDSFREGWADVVAGRTIPVSDLWN
jgi:hypothetical protein